jgi:hypothetical protein
MPYAIALLDMAVVTSIDHQSSQRQRIVTGRCCRVARWADVGEREGVHATKCRAAAMLPRTVDKAPKISNTARTKRSRDGGFG